MPYKEPSKQRQYARDHYRKNKTKYLESNNNRRKILKSVVNEIKQNTPCTDCNIQYPYYVMDFDHLSDKENLITYFVRNNNKTGLMKEIAKCDIVCSNCHRQRTFDRNI